MDSEELPIELMNRHLDNANPEGLEFLNNLCIPDYLARRYQSLEDRADALDGAFLGYQAHKHVSAGCPRDDWVNEVCFVFDREEYRFGGPFYEGLETTLNACGLEDLFKEAVDRIIDTKGEWWR